MDSIAKLTVALFLPILLLSDRARSQCIDGCACFPFSAPVTMDCTPRPDVTGVDALFTYIPAGAATTINRMWVQYKTKCMGYASHFYDFWVREASFPCYSLYFLLLSPRFLKEGRHLWLKSMGLSTIWYHWNNNYYVRFQCITEIYIIILILYVLLLFIFNSNTFATPESWRGIIFQASIRPTSLLTLTWRHWCSMTTN